MNIIIFNYININKSNNYIQMIKVSFFLSISIIIISSIFNNSINFCSRLIISAISKKKII